MDIVWLAALLILAAFCFFALERIPFPKQPPWLKQIIEILLALAFIIILAQKAGIGIPGVH